MYTASCDHAHQQIMTPDEVMELDDVVRAVVVKFLAHVQDIKTSPSYKPCGHCGTNFCFECCENWVFENVDHALAAEIVTRNAACAHALYQWVRDDGLGAWSEYREEQPESHTPADMFQEVVASWLHDIIGAPAPE